MTEENKLPLFPLNIVLYPYSKIPLYIFEERYKTLVKNCIEDRSEFGINLIEKENMYSFGCTAKIDSVVNTLEGGEMNIITSGVKRYLLKNYEMSLNGYYLGEPEFKDDFNLEYDSKKMRDAVEKYNELVEIVYQGQVSKIDLSELKWLEGKRSVAFHMAEKCGLTILEKQSLLELNTENIRLDFILDYFNDVMPKLKEAGKIAEIVRSDGYIQQ